MSLDNYKVSVVVPIYNVESYLKECLDSLAFQTLDNFEVILVNDGSTDQSYEIALDYSRRYNNFKLVSQKNSGLSSARNTGISLAKGEYLYFLDSDDYLEKNALEILYNTSQKNKLDVLKFSAFTFHDKEEDFEWNHVNGYRYSRMYHKVYNGCYLFQKTEANGDHYASSCLMLLRRQLIVDKGLKYIEGIIHEDEFFYFELMLVSKRVAVLNRPLYFRRYRKGSIMQTGDYLNKNSSLFVGIQKINDIIHQYSVPNYKICQIENSLLINAMICNWEKMNPKEQDSDECRKLMNRVKPFAKKYRYGNDFKMWLFFHSLAIYKMEKSLVKKIRGLFEIVKMKFGDQHKF